VKISAWMARLSALLLLGVLNGAWVPPGLAQADPVIAAAGDIACDPADESFNGGAGATNACRMKATSDLMVEMNLAAVLALGDTQYGDGALPKFLRSYAVTWGRLKSITHPAAGNHDYGQPKASGYYTYFGPAAGDPTKGYYSYNLGAWHFIALNSNCDEVGGCQGGSPQELWLKADLAAHPAACTLAYWHHPRFSSGPHGSDRAYDAFWRDLYQAGADVVLVGHDHDYERFAPQDPAGAADPARGIRQFVVGTGGENHYALEARKPNSEVFNGSTFGVLVMTFHPKAYDWKFLPVSGGSFTDSGSAPCH